MMTTPECSWIHLSDAAEYWDMKEIWRHIIVGPSLYSQILITTTMTQLRQRAAPEPHCVLITASDIPSLLFELPLNIIIQEQNVNFAVKRPKLQNSTDSILGINLLTWSETGINNWANFLLSCTAYCSMDTQLYWPSFAHSTSFQLYDPSCLSHGEILSFILNQSSDFSPAEHANVFVWLYCLIYLNTQVNNNGSSPTLAKCFWCVGLKDGKCHCISLWMRKLKLEEQITCQDHSAVRALSRGRNPPFQLTVLVLPQPLGHPS